MARTIVNSTITRVDGLQSRATPIDGKWVWANPSLHTASKLVTTIFERDDIHHNPMVNGFRMASPYYAFNEQRGLSFVAGQALWNVSTYVLERMEVAGGTCCDFGAPDPRAVEILSDADKQRKVIQMLNKIGDQKWNAAESLASAKQSVQLIGDSANRIARAMMYASRKNWSGVARVLRVKPPKKVGQVGTSSASGWLQYQFGWLPLVEDIAQAATYLSTIGDAKPLQLSARVSAKDNIKLAPVNSTENVVLSSNAPYFKFSHETETTLSEEWKASVYYDVSIPSLRELAKHGAVGLTTPWALMPWTFVLDWLLPIGDFLSALDATYGLTFRTGSQTSFKRSISKRKSSVKWVHAGKLHVDTATCESTGAQRMWMSRSTYLSSPIPSAFYVKDPLSVWKVITATALIRQLKSSL